MSKPPHQSETDSPPPHDQGGRVVIAGLGLITPLGVGAWPTFSALLKGATLADRAAQLPEDVSAVDLVRALGCVSVAQHTATDPAVELAERAAREAASMAGVPLKGLPVWLGTSKGAVARLSTQLGLGRPLDEESIQAVALGPHGYLANRLTQRTGCAVHSHVVGACASGLIALDSARRWLQDPRRDPQTASHALVVTAESALTEAFIHSYSRLGILAPLTLAGYRQRPLDRRRQGFMLCECGTSVLLRRLKDGETPRAGEVELLDTAVANESADLIQGDPEMPALAHVAKRLFTHRQVDVIHPHAPGTQDHDSQECSVLLQTLGLRWPSRAHDVSMYACKGALGHSLGCAGLTSLVLACLILRTGRIPAMPWLSEPITLPGEGAGLNRAAHSCNTTGTHAVFAAGFGGHTAGALLQGLAQASPLNR